MELKFNETNETKEFVGFRFEPSKLEVIDTIAKENNTNRSAVIQTILNEFIKDLESKSTDKNQ